MKKFIHQRLSTGDWQLSGTSTRYEIIEDVNGASAESKEKYARTNRLVPAPLSDDQKARILACVPKTISPVQIRLQLLVDGKTPQMVEQVIDGLTEPQRSQAKVLWEYALEFRREHPLVVGLAGVLGYDTAEKLNTFFQAAARL